MGVTLSHILGPIYLGPKSTRCSLHPRGTRKKQKLQGHVHIQSIPGTEAPHRGESEVLIP